MNHLTPRNSQSSLIFRIFTVLSKLINITWFFNVIKITYFDHSFQYLFFIHRIILVSFNLLVFLWFQLQPFIKIIYSRNWQYLIFNYSLLLVLSYTFNLSLIFYVFKRRCRRSEKRNSLYFGSPEWTTVRPSNDRQRSDPQPQNTGKVENLSAAPLGAICRVSTLVLLTWDRLAE